MANSLIHSSDAEKVKALTDDIDPHDVEERQQNKNDEADRLDGFADAVISRSGNGWPWWMAA